MTNSILLFISTTESFMFNISGILAMLIPIVAVYMVFRMLIKKIHADRDVRLMLIQNGIDRDTAAAILQENKKPKDPFQTLRVALLLIGIGLAALCCHLCGVSYNNSGMFYWLMIGFGAGLGFLCSFIAETVIRKKEARRQESQTAEDE